MRILTDLLSGRSGAVTPEELPGLYAPLGSPWLRANMVSTLDGAGTGADGLTGSINNPPDHRVFHALRRSADAILVGAGTARAEGYAGAVAPLVIVSRRGEVPPRLRDAAPGRVVLVTCAAAPLLEEARSLLGHEEVLVLGGEQVDVVELPGALQRRGWVQVLCEGGPALLGSLLAAEVVDEVCLTWVPRLVGGRPGRIVTGGDLGVPLRLGLLLEEDGTLLGRWLVERDRLSHSDR